MADRKELLDYISLIIVIALGLRFPFTNSILDDVSTMIDSFQLTESQLGEFCLALDVVIFETVLKKQSKSFQPSQKRRNLLFLDHLYRLFFTLLEKFGKNLPQEECQQFVDHKLSTVMNFETTNRLIAKYNPGIRHVVPELGIGQNAAKNRFSLLPLQFPDGELFRFSHLLPILGPLANQIDESDEASLPKKRRLSTVKKSLACDVDVS